MLYTAPGTEFLMGNLWHGNSGWHTLMKGGDKSNASMDLDSPKCPVVIWQCSKCPALAAAQGAAAGVGWLHANILRKKKILITVHIHRLSWVYHFCKRSCCCQEIFLGTYLPLEGWGEHRCLFQEGQRMGVWEWQASAGKECVEYGRDQKWEAELAHGLQGISSLGSGFFRCCLLSFCCLGSQLLPGHWGRAGHCWEGRNCVLPGGVLFCSQAAEELNCSQDTLSGCCCFRGNRTLGFRDHWALWKVAERLLKRAGNGTYIKWRKSLQLCHFSACAHPQCWEDSSNLKTSMYQLASVGLYWFVPPWDLAQTRPFDAPGQWVGVAAAEDGTDCSAEAGSSHCSSHSQVWKMLLHLILMASLTS